jgi:type IV secretory pathway VirB10-like protein
MGLFAYGGIKRAHRQAAAALGTPYRKVEPARPEDLEKELSAAPASSARVNNRPGLRPATPDESTRSAPELTGERVVVRRAAQPPTAAPIIPVQAAPRPMTQQEWTLAETYRAEQQARIAPTSIRGNSATPDRTTGTGFRPSLPTDNPAQPLEALARALSPRPTESSQLAATPSANSNNEYDVQNLQSQKEAFVNKADSARPSGDYLKYTRTPPLSRFEIKAGWEIPAVLEQGLNSDLPGELKALVMSNVYDTATGQYMLIPQGSRLVGAYSSRIGFGQNGVQVAWQRLIFPDASSIDLNGMVGIDAQGNAGLRDKVDHHYRQLFGFAVLTSMFDAALAVTQNRQQSVLVYPSATRETESAAGREVSQLGTQITRKNLNVQPTIKVPAGYVRVNRDILFEEPYRPVTPQ